MNAAAPAPLPPGVTLRPAGPRDATAVQQLLAANGWGHRVPDVDTAAALLAAAALAWVAEDGEALVGFLRGLSDGVSNGYLSMVVVAPTHRGRGLGRALVLRAIGEDERITWVLRAGRPGARAFFERLGFRASTEAMERPRRR